MNIREIPPINFLFFRVETTISELPKYGMIGQEILAEAVRLKLFITGAVHWHYTDLTDISKPFTLEISVPVASVPEEYDGKFHFKRTERTKAVTTVHDGAWTDIGETVGKIYEYIGKQQLKANGVYREIYTNVDFSDPAANQTELVIGVAG